MHRDVSHAMTAGVPAQQAALCDRLSELRSNVARRFAEARAARPEQRAPLERSALLGQELVFKLQEQLLLPALLCGEPAADDAITLADRETDLIRDLAAARDRLPDQAGAASDPRGELLAVIDGLVALNGHRVDGLLDQADAAALPWGDLLRELEALLERWHGEWQRQGEIEDEDRDPVGLPPR